MTSTPRPGPQWILLNETDGIQADPRVYPDQVSAEAGIAALRARFESRGSYLTADGRTISPGEVKLRVVPYRP